VSEPIASSGSRTIVLEPGGLDKNYWRELWVYRELFAVLAWRDIAVRYKQTVIGVAWAIVQPVLTVVIFTLVFGRIAQLPTVGVAPYPLMVFAGMLPWLLFSKILQDASNSLVSNAHLVGKVYFPRIVIPLSSAAAALVDFSITLAVFATLMVAFGVLPDWRVVLVPVFAVWAVVASLGPALLLASLNVKYRDFRHIVPFIIQSGLYLSPVGYASSVVPEKWRLLYSLNPVVGAIDGFRWCLLGEELKLYWPGMATSALAAAALFYLGIRYFRRTERSFADVL
jgi:lipopolysaccharide transport system permease protein